mgnify:CR=1 FL=1
MSLIGYSPFDRSMARVFRDMFDDGYDRAIFPYWRNVAAENALSIGSALGEVQNTAEKFAVSVDVSHFKPEELKVNVNGNVLTIEGKHEEKDDQHGSIQRSFIRKYTLPEDANMESLRSSLSDKGHLCIEAQKKTAALEQSRAIPITRG